MPVRAEPNLERRAFLIDLGRGAVAIGLITLAGCSPATLASFTPPAPAASGSGPGDGPAGTPGQATPGAGSPAAPPPGSPPPGVLAWERVNLGFVSAYLLVRGGEAALVDTGVPGSADAIEASLGGVGLGWDAVAHVILTHHHNDHAGSLPEVLSRAPAATPYAGAEDIGAIGGSVPIATVGDGDRVFDLDIVTTPGHTAGSISVLDTAAGVLVAGDAMGISAGMPTLPGAQFTVDMDEARRSIAKLGTLAFETLLVGHGDPIESGAASLVAELGAA